MNNQITPAQQKILDFLSPLEIPDIREHLKNCYRSAAFETDTKRSHLFTLWYLIELIEAVK